ncbi:uncharacterized protein LOC125048207 [Penaeus chinensis]|uniref:uncharacterized protein LOC125048207 n=1 Tax=Penaeus chinensis TaxID=139456 RepID=UPI001FB76EF1|nr:uncharacterized protein LOC125048207 [Penaeus chinensis]
MSVEALFSSSTENKEQPGAVCPEQLLSIRSEQETGRTLEEAAMATSPCLGGFGAGSGTVVGAGAEAGADGRTEAGAEVAAEADAGAGPEAGTAGAEVVAETLRPVLNLAIKELNQSLKLDSYEVVRDPNHLEILPWPSKSMDSSPQRNSMTHENEKLKLISR